MCLRALGPAANTGWLAGLKDPVVGRTLGCMHREPEYPWTLKELAKRAATSRSVLPSGSASCSAKRR